MPAADLVIQGTVDDLQPTAEAIAVSDGHIVAAGRQVYSKGD